MMNNVLKRVISRPPKCLSGFLIADYKNNSSNNLFHNADLQTKQISCQCGEGNLFVIHTPEIIRKGIIKKREIKTPLAPIFLKCPNCNNRNLLFNPTLHGWDAECGYSTSKLGNKKSELFSENSGKVIVVYTYQNIENYEDLIEDNVNNLEDFFDTFSIYFLGMDKNLVEVVSYECA